MGTIKTTNIETITGSGTLTLGQSGETISVPSGVTMSVPSGGLSGQNYPAFYAVMSDNQSISDNVNTTIQFDTEIFDTDSAFDTSTYTFTVPSGKGGKYFVFVEAYASSDGASDLEYTNVSIYVNGTERGRSQWDFRDNDALAAAPNRSMIFDLSEGDAVLCSMRINTNSGTQTIIAGSGVRKDTAFGAYRLGA